MTTSPSRPTLTVTIHTDNAAFNDEGVELARILRKLADGFHGKMLAGVTTLLDVNGNRCGLATYEEHRP